MHLREELRTRGLVLLRGQRLQGAEFAEAMRRLQSAEPSGSIERMITYETTPTNPEDDCADPAAARVPKAHLAGLPHVRRLGNAVAGGRREALLSHTPYDWHTDSVGAWQTALFCPPGGALSSGGETLLCSSAAAYDALSPAQRERAESLTAVWSNRFTGGSPSAYDFLHGLRLNASGTAVVREASSRRPSWQLSESRTPFVRRHSQTGKPNAFPDEKRRKERNTTRLGHRPAVPRVRRLRESRSLRGPERRRVPVSTTDRKKSPAFLQP